MDDLLPGKCSSSKRFTFFIRRKKKQRNNNYLSETFVIKLVQFFLVISQAARVRPSLTPDGPWNKLVFVFRTNSEFLSFIYFVGETREKWILCRQYQYIPN